MNKKELKEKKQIEIEAPKKIILKATLIIFIT